jgi:hypothetical protein
MLEELVLESVAVEDEVAVLLSVLELELIGRLDSVQS